jgi:hypothetical protein
MKKILLILCVAFFGCAKEEPTCMVCFVDGAFSLDVCVEDFPSANSIQEVREAIDPLLENEECTYYTN